MELSIPFRLASADQLHTPFTNYVKGYQGLLDYVWWVGGVGVLDLLSASTSACACIFDFCLVCVGHHAPSANHMKGYQGLLDYIWWVGGLMCLHHLFASLSYLPSHLQPSAICGWVPPPLPRCVKGVSGTA